MNWFVGIVGVMIATLMLLSIIPGAPATFFVVIACGGTYILATYVLGGPERFIEWFAAEWYRLFMFYGLSLLIKIGRKDGDWWANLF